MRLWKTLFHLLMSYFMVSGATAIEDAKIKGNSKPNRLSNEEFLLGEEAGFSQMENFDKLEEEIYAQNIFVEEGSQLSIMSNHKKPSNEVTELSRSTLRFIETLRFLKEKFGLSDTQLEEIWTVFQEDSKIISCLNPPICPKSNKYRTIDGSCNSNNPKLRNLGRAASGYRRLRRPVYSDGIYSPRSEATDGSPLPFPRNISVGAFLGEDKPLQRITNLIMQFGQFINHDMEFTTQFTFANGAGIKCCDSDNFPLDPEILKSLPECLPIYILPSDYFLNTSVTRCMNFVRSNIGPNRISCSLPVLSYAEQLNQNTHWLDASNVYGSNTAVTNTLRNPRNGLLKVSVDHFGRELLPITTNCRSGGCFIAGDQRLTEQPQLTVMHTIWMREHNRIARFLTRLNPTWSRETVFQETRRIVIAEIQHITYNEFLPALIGKTSMNKYGLTPLPGGHTFTGYSTKDLTSGPISNEFATAAFRIGHSLVQGLVQLFDENDKMSTYLMRDSFNSPDESNNQSIIYKNKAFIDGIIRGLVKEPSQRVDTNIEDDIWLLLFQNVTNTGQHFEAFDLVSLNIQRGRDHGLPSYNSYREFCGLPIITDPISSLPTDVNNSSNTSIPYFFPADVLSLSTLYKSVDDIDLYVGGLAEISTLGDGIVGPTITCLLAENFHKLKYADRYFYESSANPYPFKLTQLAEIKKASIARILCDNSDGTVAKMQPKAFFAADGLTNPMVSCANSKKIPRVNLNQWKIYVGCCLLV